MSPEENAVLLKVFRLFDTKAKWCDYESYLEYVKLKEALRFDTRINKFFLKFNPPTVGNPFFANAIKAFDENF